MIKRNIEIKELKGNIIVMQGRHISPKFISLKSPLSLIMSVNSRQSIQKINVLDFVASSEQLLSDVRGFLVKSNGLSVKRSACGVLRNSI